VIALMICLSIVGIVAIVLALTYTKGKDAVEKRALMEANKALKKTVENNDKITADSLHHADRTRRSVRDVLKAKYGKDK
jgi:type II secretory pathway pseudopilin PulG